MLKEATYTEKFEILNDWMPYIVAAIKKDLKNEHLKSDRAFCKEHFGNKPLAQIGEEELLPVYRSAIKGNEALGEFIANRWLLKHTDVYDFFEQALYTINPDFEAIDEIEAEAASEMIKSGSELFGSATIYLFTILNSVVFPKEQLTALGTQAALERDSAVEQAAKREEAATLEAMVKRHERELKRLEDRYEKKLSGMQKKYVKDTEMLKKQVANLQRKLG